MHPPNLSSPLGLAWADNSVNGVIFRKNSVASLGDWQYCAWYDPSGRLTLAKHRLDSPDWTVRCSQYRGEVLDAHRSISIMVDGDGYLHVSWDHHDSALRYARSLEAGSLELGPEEPMTGRHESSLSYPEFYRLPGGDLLFLYREGESGAGNLVMNRYSIATRTWKRLQDVLIHGEGRRNAYWQACVDSSGTIHLSWVWRETWDVATNHDLAYARSGDGGITWTASNGIPYKLPITAHTAEYALRIPQKSELINQTSICADQEGRPYIAGYWASARNPVPQYQVVWHDGTKWKHTQAGTRTQGFSLSGGGTKKIPISRPQIVAMEKAGLVQVALVFRDAERGSKVSLAFCPDIRRQAGSWNTSDLTSSSVGDWEPSFDTELWQTKGMLDLYVQNMGQGDGESLESLGGQGVWVLRWVPPQ